MFFFFLGHLNGFLMRGLGCRLARAVFYFILPISYRKRKGKEEHTLDTASPSAKNSIRFHCSRSSSFPWFHKGQVCQSPPSKDSMFCLHNYSSNSTWSDDTNCRSSHNPKPSPTKGETPNTGKWYPFENVQKCCYASGPIHISGKEALSCL